MHSLLYATLIAEYRISEVPVVQSPLCTTLLVATVSRSRNLFLPIQVEEIWAICKRNTTIKKRDYSSTQR